MTAQTVALDGRRAFVKVSGELDVSSGPALWAILQGHLADGRRYLRLDLSAVSFVDASALRGVTESHYDALALRGTLVLTGVSDLVTRVLKLAGLDDVLFIGGSRSDDDLDPAGHVRELPQPTH